MPLWILLAVLVALALPTSGAWATGPQFGPLSGGGGVVAKTCSAGDFFSAVDGGGNFTCSTSAGSGDITAVGDCANGACFDGTSGTTLTAAAAGTFVLNSQTSTYVSVDTNNDSTNAGFVIGRDASGAGATALFRVIEGGYADLRNGTDLRFHDTDDSNYVMLSAPALGANWTFTLPADDGAPNQFLQTDGSGVATWATVDTSTTNEIEVVDEAYSAANFNGGTTSGVSQDDLYDLIHAGDADDDGKPDILDTTTNGFVKTTGGTGAISIDTNTYLTTAAPVDATYITQTSNGTLTNEQAMGALGTGIVINTTTTGVQSIYAGTSCTNQFPRSLNASGAATCASVAVSTDTTGNFVATVAGTSNEITSTGSGSNNAAVTMSLPATIDLGGKDSFEVPNSAAPSTTVFGQIAGDNNEWGTNRGALQFFDGTSETILIGVLESVPPSDKSVPRFDNSTKTISWSSSSAIVPDAGAGGTATRVPYWSDADTLTDEAAFTYNAGTDTLTAVNFAGNASTATTATTAIVATTATTANDLSNGGVNLLLPDIDGTGLSINTIPDPDELFVDGAELATVTWGSGSAVNWTFNASAGTDPSISFGDNAIDFNASGLTLGDTDNASITFDNFGVNPSITGGPNELIFDVNKFTLGNGGPSSIDLVSNLAGATDPILRYGNAALTVVNAGLVLSTTSGQGLQGGGLSTDCDGLTSKLLWDTTSKQFSCGTDQTGAGTENTLLAGRAGTGNDTIISTGATGTLYGSNNASGSSLTLRATSDNTTSGEIDLNAPTVQLYQSFPPSNTTAQILMKATPTSTLSGSGVNYTMVESAPVFSTEDVSAIAHFSVRGSLARTGSVGGALYAAVGFLNDPTFTSTTSGGPLFQDAFYDSTSIAQTAGTAVQNNWVPISFLSQPEIAATGTASLTVAKMYGAHMSPGFEEVFGATLALTDYAGISVATPRETAASSGTPAITNYIGVRLEDLALAGVVTNPISVLSEGTTTQMRHAGPARFGATGAPATSPVSFDLDVQGPTNINDYLEIGEGIADLTTNTVSVVDFQPSTNLDITGNGTLRGMNFSPTTTTTTAGPVIAGFQFAPALTHSGSGVDVPQVYTINVEGTSTTTGTDTYSTASLMRHVRTYTTATTDADPVSSLIAILNNPTVSSTGASGTVNVTTVGSLKHNPTVSLNASGTTMTLLEDIGVQVVGNYTETTGTLNVTNRTGFKFNDVANTGASVENNIGLDIAALSTATNNIGIRNADTTVNTPPATVTVGAGFTLSPAATSSKINAATARTSSTTTAINDGVADGQVFTVINVDTTDIITIKDQANTQLGNDCVLMPRSSLIVQWSSDASDWIKVACSTADLAPITKKVASDVTNATTNIADITGLTGYPMVSGARYRIQGRLIYSTSTATTDIDLAFNLSAATSSSIDVTTQCQLTTATATTTTVNYARHTDDDTKVWVADTGIVSNQVCLIEGTILNGNANGTLDLRQAAHGAGVLTIVATGSYATIERMPL